MVTFLDSKMYSTLNELNETYKPNNPDVLEFEKMFGLDISLQRIMHPAGTVPRYEMKCYKIGG